MRPRLQHWGSVAGDSASSVQRIWRVHLQPHRVQQFKLSNDPKFTDKLRDVVGLYVDPPAHAIVLSVDEKSQIHHSSPQRHYSSDASFSGILKVGVEKHRLKSARQEGPIASQVPAA
jgi:hypothetical protein